MDRLRTFADAVGRKGALIPNVVAFIDGTGRAICRPGEMQRSFYNGHHRQHMLKFHGVVAPDGVCYHLWGPVVGRRHDVFLFRQSSLPRLLQRHEAMNEFHLYGDPGYRGCPRVLSPFGGAYPPREHVNINVSMSRVRICVEWTFGRIASLFAFVDFKKNLKLYLQPVGNYYVVATFLANCYCCLYGSETSDYFACIPPTLEVYCEGMAQMEPN